MPAIQVTEELAEQIEQGAHRAGQSYSDFLREAVLSRLEDLEDTAIAVERLKNPGKRIPLDQVMKNLGLDD